MPDDRRPNAFVSIVRIVLWVGVAAATAVGAWVTFTGIFMANGAPQEAAAAAMGLSIVVIPYVFARAFDEMTRGV